MLPFAGVFRWCRQEVLRVTPARLCAITLALLAGAVYVPYLSNPLVFDDFNVVNGTDFLNYAFTFNPAPRWFPYATLAHTYALTAGSTSAMRWGNLLLHAATAIAVFVLIREICAAIPGRDIPEAKRESSALVIAWVAAALFAVHPLAVYGVGYLVQRTIIMATLFMLLMLIAYWRWLLSGRTALWVWSVVWYTLSVFSKEHAVTAPAVALLMTLLLHQPSRSLVRRLLPPFVAYAVIALLVVSMVKGLLGSAYEPLAMQMMVDMQFDDEQLRGAYALSVLTQTALFFKYLFLWACPNIHWMSVDMRESFAASLWVWPYWAAVPAFVIYPVLATRMVLRGGHIGIAGWILAFPWLMFATELATVRVQEPFVLYRAYLWLPLFGTLVALALSCMYRWLAVALAIAMIGVLVSLSWNRLHTMSDTLLMWQDAARLLVRGDEPGAGRIYYNRALAYSSKGSKPEALADMNRVIALHPRLAPVYYSRARIYFDMKRYAEAISDLNKSISLKPTRSEVYYARAITYKRLGHDDEALQDLRRSCEMKDLMGCYALERYSKSAVGNP